MNQTIVQFYPDATKSLIALTNALLISAAARTKKPFYLALSGGETARSLFEIWTIQTRERAQLVLIKANRVIET